MVAKQVLLQVIMSVSDGYGKHVRGQPHGYHMDRYSVLKGRKCISYTSHWPLKCLNVCVSSTSVLSLFPFPSHTVIIIMKFVENILLFCKL